jgi:hypothetical protein
MTPAEKMRIYRREHPEIIRAIEKRRYLKYREALKKGEAWALKR